jgi:ankyrin repeat protein
VISIPDNTTSETQSQIPDIERRRFGVVVRLSDFGHSLRILYNEEAPQYLQRYGGTLVYNAPEVQRSRHSLDTPINFRKCDVWSLGLLCWEVFRDGNPYYHCDEVYKRIDSARGTSGASSTTSVHTMSSTELEELVRSCSEFAELAAADTKLAVNLRLDHGQISKLEDVYNKTLVVDPEKRVADIPFMPLFSQLSATQVSPEDDPSKNSSWTFDIFWAARFLPHYVKQQVLSDCIQLGAEPGTSDVAARAAFQAAMAFLVGFGTQKDKAEGQKWFKTSATKGLLVAGSFQPLFDETTAMMHSYLSCVRNGFRRVLISENRSTHLSAWTLSEDVYKRFDLSEGGITGVTDERGDSALMYACKLGDIQAARHLLDLSGKSPDLEKHDARGTNFLHWLFMFPDSDIPEIASRLIKNAKVPILEFSGESNDGLIPLLDSPSREQVDHLVNSPQRLDPQLPIRLRGTPLAFATATNCMAAVKTLLDHYADPLRGTVPWRENMLNESAVNIAAKLHLADILNLLLHTIACARFNMAAGDHTAILLSLAYCLPTAYPLERILIHGDNYKKAAKDTIAAIMNHLRLHTIPINLWSFLRPAIDYADLDLAEIIADITSFNDVPLELNDSELGHLIVCCTITACSATFDEAKSLGLMEFALRNGAKIDGDPATELRPINIAIDYHNTLILEWLIEQGADVNIRDSRGRTPVHVLFESDFSSSFGYATTHSLSIDTNYANENSLFQLIDAGANCIARTNDGLTPLDIAMQKGKCDDVTALLTSRCRDFVFQSNNYQSIFLQAIQMQKPEIASKVLELASMDGQLESVDLSLALCYVLPLGNLELADSILSLGADPQADVVVEEGELTKPVWIAAGMHNPGFLRLFLNHAKLDLESRDQSDLTILTMIIVFASSEPLDRSAAEAFDLVLEAGSEVNTAGSGCMYPLQFAIEYSPPIGQAYALMERLWFVKRLLKAGANPNLPMSWPYHFSKEHYHVVKDGEKELGYLPPEAYQNITPLLYAIIKGDHQLVQLLLENGASAATMSNDRRSALHVSAALTHYELLSPSTDSSSFGTIAQALLSSDIDVLYTDAESRTALELAVENNNSEVVRAILFFIRDKLGFSRRAYGSRMRGLFAQTWFIAELCTFPTNALRWLCFLSIINIILRLCQHYERIQWLKSIQTFFVAQLEKDTAVRQRAFSGFLSRNISTIMDLKDSWETAIEQERWGCVCAYIETDLYGMTSLLNLRAALQTLRYALETENAAVLTKFIGSSPSSQYSDSGPPDPALHEFWKTFQESMSVFSQQNQDRLHGIIEAGGYFPVNVAENLKTQGYVEAQQESGMVQVSNSAARGLQPDTEATQLQDDSHQVLTNPPLVPEGADVKLPKRPENPLRLLRDESKPNLRLRGSYPHLDGG